MLHLTRTARTPASHVDAPARHSVSRTIRGLLTCRGFVALFPLLVGGCGSESITAPRPAAECVGEPGCRSTLSEPLDPSVVVALDDTRDRLVPTLDDAAARASLDGALLQLEEQLKANRATEARVRLALAYAQLDRVRVALPGSDPVDLPDMSSIRLALVPVANALGVQPSF